MYTTTTIKRASLIALLFLIGFVLNSLQAQVVTQLINPLTSGPLGDGIVDFSEAKLSADGSTLITAGYNRANVAGTVGWVQVYQRSGENWIPKGPRFEDPNATPPNDLGRAIVISDDGNTIAYSDKSSETYIKAYTWNGTVWTQKGTTMEWGIGEDFGYTLSMSGDGNQLVTSEKGAGIFPLRVLRFIDGEWTETAPFVDFDFLTFSMSTAISGDGNTLALGHGDPNSGLDGVQIYHVVDGLLTQKGQIIYGIDPEDTFGARVALSSDGNTVAISTVNYSGSLWDCSTGYFKVYQFQGGNWAQQGGTIFDNTGMNCWEGRSLLLSHK